MAFTGSTELLDEIYKEVKEEVIEVSTKPKYPYEENLVGLASDRKFVNLCYNVCKFCEKNSIEYNMMENNDKSMVKLTVTVRGDWQHDLFKKYLSSQITKPRDRTKATRREKNMRKCTRELRNK